MSFAERIAAFSASEPLPTEGERTPLGAALIPGTDRGLNLAAHGYVELEYLVAGMAETWSWNSDFKPVPVGERPFTTRVLVRIPSDPAKFSGGVQLEPHHPDDDRALSWGAIAPWVLRNGHAHVGVTQEPATVPDLIDWDPDRYGALSIEHPTQRWELLGQVAVGVREGLIPAFEGLAVDRIVMSGWSMTGTFCRTFAGEGFHELCTSNGRPAVDGYVICISSGGAGRAGYGSLRDGVTLPPGDPRRVAGPSAAPIFELLSEGESETHHLVLRDDADAPDDRYRLYQVAGCGHINGARAPFTTNGPQRRMRGTPKAAREIVERHTDARMDLVARAVFEAMDRLLVEGAAPPHADRFTYLPAEDPGVRGMMVEALPLARDPDRNVLGGVRTPWVVAPSAAYLPHSTPVPGRCEPAAHAPYSDPRMLADLIAHMEPFTAEDMRARYGSREIYLERFAEAVHALSAQRLLLEDDLSELLDGKRESSDEF
jgi:hypothetical protein